jgi:3-methyladenine DNA glycosylase AlkD
MTLKQTLAALKKAGTAQTRKVYARHGVAGDQYGVSFAELKKLKKAIKTDHDLARELWATGNHDARVLACMVADPDAFTSRELDAWARDLDSYVVTDAFVSVVAKSPHRDRKFAAWKDRKGEWPAAAAWGVFCALAMHEDDRPDAFFLEQLAAIEAEIHSRPNRVRHNMNQAVICIGIRNGALKRKAVAAAKRIGRVEVDHGDTSCKTPDPVAYIEKTLAHRAKRT